MTSIPLTNSDQKKSKTLRKVRSSSFVDAGDSSTFLNYNDIPLNGISVTNEQDIEIACHGLKPNTRYVIYDGDTDVSDKIEVKGKKYGDITSIVSDNKGKLDLRFFRGRNVTSDTSYAIQQNRNINRREQTELRVVEYGNLSTNPVASCIIDADYSPYAIQTINADLVQTFFVDQNSVNNSSTVSITGIDLFFKRKPNTTNNISGVDYPSVSIALVDVDSNGPVLTKFYKGSLITLDHNYINTSTDASIKTSFVFEKPIQVKTGKNYGVAILAVDTDYEYWYNKTGDVLVGTNNVSSGSSASADGKLYLKSNAASVFGISIGDELYKEINDIDLKFAVNVAKFTANTITVDLVNKDYEFFTVSNINGSFIGGEYVWLFSTDGSNTAYQTGNVSVSSSCTVVTGIGTNFSNGDILLEGDFIVITDGTDANTDVRQIQTITNATSMVLDYPTSFTASDAEYILSPVGKVHSIDALKGEMILIDSSARSNGTLTAIFSANSVLKGINSGANLTIDSVYSYPVQTFLTNLSFNTPTLTTANVQYNFANSTYNVAAGNKTQSDLFFGNHVINYGGFIHSRSLEVSNKTNLHLPSDDYKSSYIQVTFNHKASNTNLFETPNLRTESGSIMLQKWDINNSATNEHTSNGSATSKHITQKIKFQEGKSAEDIRVYLTGYRPSGTTINVYAKIHNSKDPEAFDDKDWTLLSIIDNENKYSAKENREDIIEYSYSFPNYPPTDATLPGVITTELANNIIVGSGTQFTDSANGVSAGDIVKIYSPLFDENYVIAVVDTVDSDTQVTLTQEIANNNVVGDNFIIDTLTTPYTAFTNITNDYVVRYHDKSGSIHDTYDSMSIKIVLLAENNYLVPFVEDIRVVGVSA